MKKYFIIAIAALAASAACSKVETIDNTPDVPVTFQAANYTGQTKAVSVLNDFQSFKCRAFLHAQGIDLNSDGSVKTTTTYQEFFGSTGETITPDNTTNPTEWAPSHTYYWPKGEQSFVNFVGWYGKDGSGAASDPTITYAYDGTAGKYKATLEWAYTSATVGNTTSNLLYADMAWRFKANNNPATYGADSVTEGVPMLFRHALAQINLKAYVTKGDDPADAGAITAGTTAGTVKDNNATWTIQLKDVVITPIYTSGTLNLTNVDPGTEATENPWTGGWTVGSTTSNYTVAGPVAVDQVSKPASTSTAGDVIAKTCVFPQSLTSVNLTFKLYIKTEYSGGLYNEEEIPYTIAFTGGTQNLGTSAWAMNTKYTYYLKINPSQKVVLFDPALEADWTTGTTNEQTI